MEKDSDLRETGSKGVGIEAGGITCLRLPSKGSRMEITERNLFVSILQELC